ncbi:MAG: hypothetical protein JXB38_04575 [Anaerolineales bacterium]|nr:hypothetical protein [Anaerolineales bacterium]
MAEQTSVLNIFALGPPEIRLGERLVIFPTRKPLTLLIYLAIEGELQPCEHLAVLLWPDASLEHSYASLRNTLGQLQTILRRSDGQTLTPYLSVTHHALGLNPGAEIEFDLQTIAQAYKQARADRSS